VEDQTYVMASPSASVDPEAVHVIAWPVGVEVWLQSTVGAVGALFGGGGGLLNVSVTVAELSLWPPWLSLAEAVTDVPPAVLRE
jgi:hypothetical protein